MRSRRRQRIASVPLSQRDDLLPDRWRLAVASVPNEPDVEPTVRYLVAPFRDVTLHFAQTKVPLNVANLLNAAKAIGVDQQTGSLDAGKMGDVVLWNDGAGVYTSVPVPSSFAIVRSRSGSAILMPGAVPFGVSECCPTFTVVAGPS